MQHMFVGGLAYTLPRFSIPRWLFDENAQNHVTWSNADYISYIVEDGYPENPNGLSYGGNIQFATLYSVLCLGQKVQQTLEHASYDWLLFHDPHDTTVNIGGSRLFMSRSPSHNKRLITVEGGLHDIIANDTKCIIDGCIDWLSGDVIKKG
jgi:hypothetical protein